MINWPTATTDEKIAAVNALDGRTMSQAAAELGIEPASLHGFCFRNRGRVKRPPAKLTAWHLLRTSEARAARVRELDDAGMRTKDIAALLGVTPGWIVQMMTGRRAPVIHGGPRPKMGPSEPRFPVHPLPPAETWLPHRAPVSMGGLNEYTCRWPIEVDGKPQGYCGGHVHKRSYCARHYAVAYRVVGE